jgi:hypothetical protein
LIGVQGSEDSPWRRCLLRRHDEGGCRVLFVEGGRLSSPEQGTNVGHLSLITMNHKTRKHNLLNVKDLRPSKHYFPSDIMNLRRRS